jgi:hypothetical protein
MGRRKETVAAETPQEARQRLVAELRLFNHREAADLLEADGRAGELEPEYGTWSPNARGKAKLQEFGAGEEAAVWARERADFYNKLTVADKNIHRDPDAVGVWRLVSEWMPMVGYEKPEEKETEEG